MISANSKYRKFYTFHRDSPVTPAFSHLCLRLRVREYLSVFFFWLRGFYLRTSISRISWQTGIILFLHSISHFSFSIAHFLNDEFFSHFLAREMFLFTTRSCFRPQILKVHTKNVHEYEARCVYSFTEMQSVFLVELFFHVSFFNLSIWKFVDVFSISVQIPDWHCSREEKHKVFLWVNVNICHFSTPILKQKERGDIAELWLLLSLHTGCFNRWITIYPVILLISDLNYTDVSRFADSEDWRSKIQSFLSGLKRFFLFEYT